MVKSYLVDKRNLTEKEEDAILNIANNEIEVNFPLNEEITKEEIQREKTNLPPRNLRESLIKAKQVKRRN